MVFYTSLTDCSSSSNDGRIFVDESDYRTVEDEPVPFEIKDVVRIRAEEKFAKYYECLEELGEGKFGKVYLCREKHTGFELAAKRIKIRRDADRAKVEREVAIMTQMRHPRIAQIYDAFATPENDIVLVMEVVKGGELFDRVVDENYILTELAVVMIMCQLCEAVGYIHSKNIVHLDIKPENIMCVSKTGNRIKLIDFGLAQYYDGSSNLLFMAGTPEFVAPEVIKYEPIDFYTDMWSIGVLTYILLSGISPFLGDTLGETYCAVERGQWEFDEEAFEGISDAAKDFIAKLLIIDQTKRMLPEDCLNHEWIVGSRFKAANDLILNQPNTGKPLSKESIKSYIHNKRFKRAAWALVFLSKFKKYGLISLKDLKEESYSNNITRTNNKKSNSCVSTSKIFKNDSEFLQTSIRWSVRLSNGSTESAFESLLKVDAKLKESPRKVREKEKMRNVNLVMNGSCSNITKKAESRKQKEETNKKFNNTVEDLSKRKIEKPRIQKMNKAGTVAKMLSFFAEKIEANKRSERKASRAGRTLRDIHISTPGQEITMLFANEHSKKTKNLDKLVSEKDIQNSSNKERQKWQIITEERKNPITKKEKEGKKKTENKENEGILVEGKIGVTDILNNKKESINSDKEVHIKSKATAVAEIKARKEEKEISETIIPSRTDKINLSRYLDKNQNSGLNTEKNEMILNGLQTNSRFSDESSKTYMPKESVIQIEARNEQNKFILNENFVQRVSHIDSKRSKAKLPISFEPCSSSQGTNFVGIDEKGKNIEMKVKTVDAKKKNSLKKLAGKTVAESNKYNLSIPINGEVLLNALKKNEIAIEVINEKNTIFQSSSCEKSSDGSKLKLNDEVSRRRMQKHTAVTTCTGYKHNIKESVGIQQEICIKNEVKPRKFCSNRIKKFPALNKDQLKASITEDGKNSSINEFVPKPLKSKKKVAERTMVQPHLNENSRQNLLRPKVSREPSLTASDPVTDSINCIKESANLNRLLSNAISTDKIISKTPQIWNVSVRRSINGENYINTVVTMPSDAKLKKKTTKEMTDIGGQLSYPTKITTKNVFPLIRIKSETNVTPKSSENLKKIQESVDDSGMNQKKSLNIRCSVEDSEIKTKSLEASRFDCLKMSLESRIIAASNERRLCIKQNEIKLPINISDNTKKAFVKWKEMEQK